MQYLSVIPRSAWARVKISNIHSQSEMYFRDQLLSAFLDDPAVLEIGRICLFASIVIGPFLGFYQICTTYLQASGKSKEAVIVSLLEKGIVYIPLLFLMSFIAHS